MSKKNVIVIGASISGLASATALSQAGHRVRILEAEQIPECATPLEALETWERKGSPQARHTHAFLARLHKIIMQHSPDLMDRLREAGAELLPFSEMIPPTIENPEFIAEDEEITLIGCRRITFEWVLRRYVQQTLGVPILHGHAVEGLVSNETRSSVPVVSGVRARAADGSQHDFEADFVLDASGRRSKMAGWLEAIGARPLREEAESCGIFYSSRFYRLREGAKRPFTSGFAGGDLGYLKYGVFPGDENIFSLILAASPDDPELALLRRPEGFNIAMKTFPLSAEWVASDFSEPITEVHTMAGLRNVRRFFVDEGEPLALGFQPLGDSLIHSNPILGRGCTYAFIGAYLMADALDRHPDDLRQCALAFDEGIRDEVAPGYEFTRVQDRSFIKNARALYDPQPEEAAGSGAADPAAFMQSILRDGFVPAMATDIVVLRAFMRAMTLLDPLESMMKKPEVTGRIMNAWNQRETRERVVQGPSRDELVAQLQRANGS